MKKIFNGHFKPSRDELKTIWSRCLFVFDANILLNLYRYSDPTRTEFTNVLKKTQNNIWIPHRVAEEYFNNRLTVIQKQETSYVEAIKSITSLKDNLDNARHHPFVSPDVMKKANTAFDALRTDLKSNMEQHNKRIYDDDIKDSIASLFNDRVGAPYDAERLEKLIAEGELRYKHRIPPGYKDSSKKPENDSLSEKCRAFGDLIIWNQIIDKSREINKGIVLVIDDKKEDWWEVFNGKIIGPRPELVKEFCDLTNNSLYMYQADRFLELAKNHLGEKVDRGAMEEMRAVRKEFNEQIDVSEKRRGSNFKDALLKNFLNTFDEISGNKNEKVQMLSIEQEEIDSQIRSLRETLKLLNDSKESTLKEMSILNPNSSSYFTEREDHESSLKKLRGSYRSVTDKIEDLEIRKAEIERRLISLLL